jgi:hypothetical protein
MGYKFVAKLGDLMKVFGDLRVNDTPYCPLQYKNLSSYPRVALGVH